METNKPFFSIIIASYLGDYPGAASSREQKFVRAIESIRKQTFDDYEIIVVSDGCQKTMELCEQNNINCIPIQKQPLFSGQVRNAGIAQAKGRYIIYLDTDDYWLDWHLNFVNQALINKNYPRFIYFDDNINTDTKMQLGKIGTSNICHVNSPDRNWNGCNGYGHDWQFISKKLGIGIKVGKSGYVVCHVPNKLDV